MHFLTGGAASQTETTIPTLRNARKDERDGSSSQPERRNNMRLCDLDEIKICVDRQYENCHGYSGSKQAIYREAILAVKSILHSAKTIRRF